VLQEKKQDAVVLARAGLLRLKKYQKYARIIPENIILPAVGQAALGIQVRSKDLDTIKIVRKINHAKSFREVAAERRFLQVLQGGCRVPVGISAKIAKRKISLHAAVFSVKTTEVLRASLVASESQYEAAGEALAKQLLKMGAARLLREARS
jgi:hydroxymethylbilane synthase